MHSRPSLSTGNGDDGSSEIRDGTRMPKSSLRFHAIGSIDELDATVGFLVTEVKDPDVRERLLAVQRTLYGINAELSLPGGPSGSCEALADSLTLEEWGSAMEKALAPLHAFILPGGSRAAALAHVSRTVCRRAERWVSALSGETAIDSSVVIYLNRLGDVFFLLARILNRQAGVDDITAKEGFSRPSSSES